MKIAELSTDEDLRLETLYAYQILDTPRETAFEELAELTQLLTGCSIVAIGFMDRHRYWFKAARGVEGDSVDRQLSLCSPTMHSAGSVVVEDLTEDLRYQSHPMVESGLCLRFYAGSCIRSNQGQALGTVCVADPSPRIFTAAQKRGLEIIAQQVSLLLESRLKHLHLQSRAGQLIQLEQKTVQRNLALQEMERQEIGYELHERYAQTLAACHTFLSVAEHDEGQRVRMIRQTRGELQRLTREMRTFSRKLTPTTMERFAVGEMLQTLVRDVQKTTSFTIRLETSRLTDHLSRELALALYRNTQEFLQLLTGSADVTSVLIRLKVSTRVSLLLMDNRPPQTAVSLEQDTLVRTIHNRTLHFGGTVQYKPFSVKGNALQISLPLVC